MEPISTIWPTQEYITTWRQFEERIRGAGRPLLARLDDFPRSLLVTGCQRSGTTMLSRLLTRSDGMVNYWFGPDDELDAALILSGYVEHAPQGRYCFQTTYIGAGYTEYFDHRHGDHRILFVLRNPFSVVHSMLHNWDDDALDRLFATCGAADLRGRDALLRRWLGGRGIPRLRRACWAYNAKLAQIPALRKVFGPRQMMVVDYDDLVTRKEELLPAIYRFVELTYSPAHAARIHARSLAKTRNLPTKETETIRQMCEPLYRDLRRYATAV